MLEADHVKRALRAWGAFTVLSRLEGGYRNIAFLVEQDGRRYVAKTSRRNEAALAWLTDVHAAAEAAGFVVPKLIPNPNKTFLENGITLEPFIDGVPFEPHELDRIRPNLERFHDLTRHLPQRPGFASSVSLLEASRGGDVDFKAMPARLVHTCREAWSVFHGEPQSVVHGDLNPTNLLHTADGVALLDWDESRVDASYFDSLILKSRDTRTDTEQRALDAWEVAVCWSVEPEHARAVAARLR